MTSKKDWNPSTVSSMDHIKKMFIFSPFGLRCGQCSTGATIQFDERSIQIHLKKHGLDNGVATVRSFFVSLKEQCHHAKALGTIEPYRSDNNTYIGFLCICGQVFQLRKDSALRHCKKVGCDASKLQNVDLIKLCCGRYVSQSQVTAFFNKQHTERTISISPAPVVALQDIPRLVSPSIPEIFIFSPFGLCCRTCSKGARIQLEERSVFIHLKKHGTDVTISAVRTILQDFRKQVLNARVSKSIEP